MDDKETERIKARKDWLTEHDYIQSELLNLKREASILKDGALDRQFPSPSTQPSTSPPQSPAPSPERLDAQPPAEPSKVEKVDDLIKEMQVAKEGGGAPRLPLGKIPTSPDLASKIANLIQSENKTKRQMYEAEKECRKREQEARGRRGASGPIIEEKGKQAEEGTTTEAGKTGEGGNSEVERTKQNILAVPKVEIEPSDINDSVGKSEEREEYLQEIEEEGDQDEAESVTDPCSTGEDEDGPPEDQRKDKRKKKKKHKDRGSGQEDRGDGSPLKRIFDLFKRRRD